MRTIEPIVDFENRFEVMDWCNSFQTYVPVYFLYNEKRCFIHNRRVYGVPYGTPEAKADEKNYIGQLQKNDGKFFCFYNGYRTGLDIEAFTQWIWGNGYTLTDDFKISRNKQGNFVDIGGNFKEVSCAFSYRIYDEKLSKRIIKWFRDWKANQGSS